MYTEQPAFSQSVLCIYINFSLRLNAINNILALFAAKNILQFSIFLLIKFQSNVNKYFIHKLLCQKWKAFHISPTTFKYPCLAQYFCYNPVSHFTI